MGCGTSKETGSREIQLTIEENNVQLEQFEDRIIFTSMCNDIDWREAGNKEACMSNFFRRCGEHKKIS